MVTSLHTKESGIVQFSKRPGAILENGACIAKMSLDDPSQCMKAEQYTGPGFPIFNDELSSKVLNLSQGYLHAKQKLDNTLDGFCCPDEFFKLYINRALDDYFKYLKDPKLPLDEIKEVMAAIQGRIPHKVEKSIIRMLTNYEHNITSVLTQFPAQRITAELMGYLACVDPKDKDMVELTLQPLIELCSRYKNGVKGQMISAVSALITRYLEVEKLFQVGHYDKVISTLRQLNKDNIDVVVDRVFAHTQYKNRNMLITTMLDKLWHEEPRLIKNLKPALQALTKLVRSENATVTLKARTILIGSEKPSYEQRHNHMERIFLDGFLNKTTEDNGDLEKIINDDSSIFDVLGDFFYHHEDAVRAAALEVYVRRAYASYELMALTNLSLGSNLYALKFDFLLPQTHPNRELQRSLKK